MEAAFEEHRRPAAQSRALGKSLTKVEASKVGHPSRDANSSSVGDGPPLRVGALFLYVGGVGRGRRYVKLSRVACTGHRGGTACTAARLERVHFSAFRFSVAAAL